MFKVEMFVESSTRNIKKVKRKYGVVLQFEGKNGIRTKEIFGSMEGTYNQVILLAITEGLKHLKDGCEVDVYQNNDFLTCMIEKSMHAWKENGFTTKKGDPIKNQEEWIELSREMDRHMVKVETVGSHTYSNWLLTQMDRYVDSVDNQERAQKH